MKHIIVLETICIAALLIDSALARSLLINNEKHLECSSEQNFTIAIISDLDKESKSEDPNNKELWIGYLRTGILNYDSCEKLAIIEWNDPPLVLKSKNNYKNRGMELSELLNYNGNLLSFDDHTGIIYRIDLNKDEPQPWVQLKDGDGKAKKFFKAEWAAIKDKLLYVGSTGHEWIDHVTKEVTKIDSMYIKTVSKNGTIEHINWQNKYNAMRGAAELPFPGYIWHEAAVWSDVHKKWFFLPRKCSKEIFNPKTEEKMGCNLLIKSDETFQNIQILKLMELDSTHGYSSFKFIPGTEDTVLVALSTRETEANGQQSYISVFTIDGDIVLKEHEISHDKKYEGIEFLQ